MKSPDVIKKGLPLYTPEEIKEILQQKWTIHSHEKLYRSALALIQQLEAQNAELLKKVEQLQAERDAAVRDVRKWCCTCKHCAKAVREAPCNSCRRNGQGGTEECWEWRGVQKEE